MRDNIPSRSSRSYRRIVGKKLSDSSNWNAIIKFIVNKLNLKSTAGVPSFSEPSGWPRDKWEETIISWKFGRPLVWDVTCDTLTTSHLPSKVGCADAASARAENLKRRKYNGLCRCTTEQLYWVEKWPWDTSAFLVFPDIAKRLIRLF